MKAVATHWDEVWTNTHVQAPHDTVLNTIESLGVTSILEIGAGSGRDLEELNNMGMQVMYTDFSKVAATSFARRCQGTPVIMADATGLPFPDDSFDLVVSLGLIEHFDVSERLTILREKFRVSKHYVLVDVPQKYSATYLIKKALMAIDRWPYGEETEFSRGSLVAQVRSVAPQAVLVSSYGRELIPLPRNFKQRIYGKLPPAARQTYIRSHRLFSYAVGGSMGLVFDKCCTCLSIQQ